MDYVLIGNTTIGNVIWAIVTIIVLANAWGLAGRPRWKVWVAHQKGLADLTKARNEQQIQIAEAQSRLAAADLNKQAAIIEAEAVSAQIKEIGMQLTAHDLYLRWQWFGRRSSNDSFVPVEEI